MEPTKTDTSPGVVAATEVGGVLEIPQYVDALTGNIDSPGDVVVHRGVREGCSVKAGGNLEVRGIIEGATIECGGHLTAHGGIAGHERGQLRVAGMVRAKYLNNFGGQVRGDLVVEREIINSDLTIGGQARCPSGAIIGGHLIVTGCAEVSVLGSSAETPTQLVLGTVPFFEGKLAQLEQVVAQLTEARALLTAEQQRLERQHIHPTAQERERQTEILFEAQGVDEKLARALHLQDSFQKQVTERQTIQVDISHRLFRGVVFTLAGTDYQITEDCRGPLRIAWQAGVGPVYQREGAAPTPLIQIARALTSAVPKSTASTMRSVPCAS